MYIMNLFTIIIFIKIKIYLSNSYIVHDHSEYISLMNSEGEKENYDLDLVTSGKKLSFNVESNTISQINNLFYYLTKNDNNWKNIISASRNYFILYFEDLNTFHSKISEILSETRIKARVKQIIIGCNSSCSKNELNSDINKTNMQIFFNNNRDKIKSKFSTYSSRVFCSTYINFIYSGDYLADFFVFFLFSFILVFTIFWMVLHHKARKNGKYLFVHSYLLAVFIFYFLHTIFYFVLTLKNKYKHFDEEIFSGALYNFFCFLQFFTKLLPGLCATIQLNLFELQDHFRIIRNSKVIHILSANIFFIISLENENQNLSETLNILLQILIIICLFYMFFQFKNCLEDKISEAIIDQPELVHTLKYKKNLLYMHCFCILSFSIIYYLIIFLFRNSFSQYRTTKFVVMMINYSDLFLTLILCGVHFPRELPPQYIEEINLEPDIDFNNVENDFFENIYSYTQVDEEKYFENYKSGDSSNIVIVENPYNENKIEVEIEEETEEEEEEGEEEKEEEKEKEEINGKKNNDKKDNDIHIETTEEDSVDYNKENNIINNVEDEEKDEKQTNTIVNDEEDHNILVSKDAEIINVLNKSCIEEDILDISHTKLGYIEIP